MIKHLRVLMASTILLAGCQNLTAPVPPIPAQIAKEAEDLSRAALAGDPIKYQKVGYGIVERECNIFFDSLNRLQDQANFARQELTLTGAAAAGVLAAVSAGAVPITIAGIAFPLVANSIGNAQNTTLITPYPDETYGLVRAALKAYRDAASLPTDIYDAVAQVQNYAGYCSYSGIHQLAKQALATAKASAEDQPPAPAGAAGLGAPTISAGTRPRAIIPNIVINAGRR